MRLNPDQLFAVYKASEVMLDVTHGDDPGRPWVDVEVIDTTDFKLISVRWPGRCMPLPEDMIGATGEDGYVRGVFVVLIDEAGEYVHAKHTAVGTLKLRHGVAVSP